MKKVINMKVRINGYTFENNTPNRILFNYNVPDWLKNDAEIYAYLQMSFEKSGWMKYLFTFNRVEEEENE